MKRAAIGDLGTAPIDVLVIGGGIYGLMVARDAALRGVETVLIERDDWGGGTSHNSLKIMHGGIRYVQHLDIGRLRASAREQAFWQRAAPDLIQPLDFVIPLFGHGVKGPAAFAAAAAIYALASKGLRGPDYRGARVVGPAEAARRMGDLAPQGLSGGGVWRDGQILDANRLHLACLRGAVDAGARAANHMEATNLLRMKDAVIGAVLRDQLDGREGEVRAKVVISCTGAEAPRVAGGTAEYPGFARAMNIVVDRPSDARGIGIVSRSRSDAAVDRGGRMYFLTPWQGRTIIGTHEAPAPDLSARDRTDIPDFLAEIRVAAPALGLSERDVLWTYQGLIPADVDDGRGAVQRMTKGTLIDHSQSDGTAGLISVMGVKYTTARLIAERAVDRAARQLNRTVPPSAAFDTLLPSQGLATFDPGDETAFSHRIRAAIKTEMAATLADILLRRTPLVETGRLDTTGLERAADLAAAEAGWNDARRAEEIASARAQILSP